MSYAVSTLLIPLKLFLYSVYHTKPYVGSPFLIPNVRVILTLSLWSQMVPQKLTRHQKDVSCTFPFVTGLYSVTKGVPSGKPGYLCNGIKWEVAFRSGYVVWVPGCQVCSFSGKNVAGSAIQLSFTWRTWINTFAKDLHIMVILSIFKSVETTSSIRLPINLPKFLG